MKIKTWNIEKVTGYKPQTTFYEDFSIADKFGMNAIKDTYNRAFNHWKDNVIYLTELVLALNWKIWEHCETNDEYAVLYDELWRKTADYAVENLKGTELAYYLETVD